MNQEGYGRKQLWIIVEISWHFFDGTEEEHKEPNWMCQFLAVFHCILVSFIRFISFFVLNIISF
jgi:hypothetical protein